MQKDGHKFDFDTVAETLRAMQHAGLIENRPYKGEESFYVIDGAAAISVSDDVIQKQSETISTSMGNTIESDSEINYQAKLNS